MLYVFVFNESERVVISAHTALIILAFLPAAKNPKKGTTVAAEQPFIISF